MDIGLREKCPLFLSDFNETLNLLGGFSKNPEISNFMKIRSSGSRVVPYGRTDGRTDGRKDMKKLIILFHNFANPPKN